MQKFVQPVSNHDLTPDEVEIMNQLHILLQATLAYLRNPSHYQGTCFKRFLDNINKKVILLIYYLTNCVYSIAAVSIQRDHYAYYLVYFFITMTGLVFEAVTIVTGILEIVHRSSRIRGESLPQEARATEHRNYYRKAKAVFIDCVLLSLGELLIHPILVCTLYGFINERAWQFNSAIAGLNSLFFLYSLLMGFAFNVILVIHLVKTIIKAKYGTYTQSNVLVQPLQCNKIYHLILPFATATASTQWAMIGITVVRMYVDSFTTEKDNVDCDLLNTGNYRMTPYTGYMIGFALCFPIFASVVFVLLNKSVIHRSTITCICRSESNTLKLLWSIKLFAFIRDPIALLAVIVFMTLFIIFSVGAYLPDYDLSCYDGARTAIEGLGACFIIYFMIFNLQATIIFVIMLLTITTMLLCVLYVVCACLYTCHNDQTV